MANFTLARMLAQTARSNLQRQHSNHVQGYVPSWQDNLLDPVWANHCHADLSAGAGQELVTKFRALHSSSCLAVNHFAPFKTRPVDLAIGRRTGFNLVRFEEKHPNGISSTPPHLDVWLEGVDSAVAIESKFLEYFAPKVAKFSNRYTICRPPLCDDPWWDVFQQSPSWGMQYLDVAQLAKHALGLLGHLAKHPGSKVELIYLYWEPTNAAALVPCVEHRSQAQQLAVKVANSKVPLVPMSYLDLWQEWEIIPALQAHVSRLKARYEMTL